MNNSIGFYNNNAHSFFENTIDVDMAELYAEFTVYLSKNSEILDAGCGSGRDSKYFLESGYSVTAIDASMALVKLASKATQLNVKCMTFEDVNWVDKFSGIWACASLLHLNDYELENAFLKLFNALKNHGVLYCSFKYGEINSVVNERFFNNQTELTIKELLRKEQNITFEKTWVTSDKRPGRSEEKWLNAIITKE